MMQDMQGLLHLRVEYVANMVEDATSRPPIRYLSIMKWIIYLIRVAIPPCSVRFTSLQTPNRGDMVFFYEQPE